MFAHSSASSFCFFSVVRLTLCSFFFFFFNDTATTEIYTLSLHDALPISHFPGGPQRVRFRRRHHARRAREEERDHDEDRKSTRLNSSHLVISYAVFCLKKKKKICSQFTCNMNPAL